MLRRRCRLKRRRVEVVPEAVGSDRKTVPEFGTAELGSRGELWERLGVAPRSGLLQGKGGSLGEGGVGRGSAERRGLRPR